VPKPGEDVRSRGLSDSEKNYAKEVYGEGSIDLDAIVITRGSLLSAGAPRTTGNTINLTDDQFDGDTMNLSDEGMLTLVHEMAHVWQFEHGGGTYIPEALWAQAKAWVTTGTRNAAYDWLALDEQGVPWEEWNPEAQAEAVEDYNKQLRFMQASDPQFNPTLFAKASKYVEKMRVGPKAP
jgi:hypothetical protein